MRIFVVLGVLLTTAHLLAGKTSDCLDLGSPPPNGACFEFFQFPLEVKQMIAEYLSPKDFSKLRSTNKDFYFGLKSLKSHIIRTSLVQHFRKKPGNPWEAEFSQKVSLSSISEAIKALPENLKITKRLSWSSSILAGKSLEKIGTFLEALPENLKITDQLSWHVGILEDKSLEEILAFLEALPEHLKITDRLSWSSSILKDKS